jgi:ketosteroid isomerase-like protein
MGAGRLKRLGDDVAGERRGVRGIHEAVARRDYVTPSETYAENVIWEVSNASWTALGIEPVYQGHDGIRQFWRDVLSVIGEFDLEVEELIDAGDQVVAVARERGVGRASGVPLDWSVITVWTVADGKVTHVQVVGDRHHALEAAGLRE